MCLRAARQSWARRARFHACALGVDIGVWVCSAQRTHSRGGGLGCCKDPHPSPMHQLAQAGGGGGARQPDYPDTQTSFVLFLQFEFVRQPLFSNMTLHAIVCDPC